MHSRGAKSQKQANPEPKRHIFRAHTKQQINHFVLFCNVLVHQNNNSPVANCAVVKLICSCQQSYFWKTRQHSYHHAVFRIEGVLVFEDDCR